ncbi:hypothetical protein AB7M16_000109 [Bradyrhizobium sp. USDA 372]
MAELHPVMNDTKWRELRDAMYAIGSATIYRIMRVNGYYSNPDAEWFYTSKKADTTTFGMSIFSQPTSLTANRLEAPSKRSICPQWKPVMASACTGTSCRDKPSII